MQLVKLSSIFDLQYGNSFELNSLDVTDEKNSRAIDFVARTEKNQGVSARVLPLIDIKPFSAGLITVALSGSVLETFLQAKPFYTGYHVMVLHQRREMDELELLFYCACIRKNKYRYNYGRQANRTLKDILVPAEMPSSFRRIRPPQISKAPFHTKKFALTDRKSEWFTLQALFDIKKGKRLTKEKMAAGTTPFIGSTELNNGVTASIADVPIHKGNTISVTYNGSVAEAFYQPADFWASDDVNVLYPKFELNEYRALFLTTLIRREKYRFNYGRKWHLERMQESKIRLPITSAGKPDWQFMEDYIKSLPYSAGI